MTDKLPPTSHPKCGTVYGHLRHRRRGEEPCQACLSANQAYHREYAHRRRATPEGRTALNAASRQAKTKRGGTRRLHERLRARTEAEADADFARCRPDGKACRGCGEVLEAAAFSRSSTSADGRQAYCSRNGCNNKHTRLKRDAKLAAHWESRGIDPHVCIYCQTNPATDLEHVFPKALGGQDEFANYAPACQPCNGSKNATHPITWLQATHPERLDAIVALFPHIALEASHV